MTANHAPRRAITDPVALVERLELENDALMTIIASLESRTLSSEEIAYLRNRKEADERALWAWQWLRANVPIIAAVCTALGVGAYWLLTNLSLKAPR